MIGAVRVNGCTLNFKDKTVEPPVLLANSLMECGFIHTGVTLSLRFVSHDGSQTVTILNREIDRDDTWPFFCQVRVLFQCCTRYNITRLITSHKSHATHHSSSHTGLRHRLRDARRELSLYSPTRTLLFHTSVLYRPQRPQPSPLSMKFCNILRIYKTISTEARTTCPPICVFSWLLLFVTKTR